jgi:hypothetical protein
MGRFYFGRVVSFALVAIISIFSVKFAEACAIARPEDFNTLKKATLVVQGKLTAELQFVQPLARFRPAYYRAKILVTKTLVGATEFNGTELAFVFYRPANKKVRGVSKDVEIIVGLRRPGERESSASSGFIESTWFSVASSCDSMGVIVLNGNNLEDIKRGIKGEHKRFDIK